MRKIFRKTSIRSLALCLALAAAPAAMAGDITCKMTYSLSGGPPSTRPPPAPGA